MIARRGKVAKLWSDNRTNFKGANRELRTMKVLLNSQEFKNTVIADLANEGIRWKFISPSSPYMGGIWEAGVKAFKHHFKRVTDSLIVSIEGKYIFLSLIKSCLNSRPLTPLSNVPNDLEVIAPGHFLIGEALTAPIEPIEKMNRPRNQREAEAAKAANLWDALKLSVRCHKPAPMNLREIEQVVLVEWENIPQETIHNLINMSSMPRCMVAVIRARGESTRICI
ncbi:hypothetical protein ILUMI_03368 [Ignelater luminosus]|uniref:Integrase catalytic domain-containing protein n=1 Tax=Ignelater luminosus TaxID=2038154 RepID=A0A8K0GFK3_IGNLU|nr:hypothetical protein ILUMI_03368 [Ignelater luminosus]